MINNKTMDRVRLAASIAGAGAIAIAWVMNPERFPLVTFIVVLVVQVLVQAAASVVKRHNDRLDPGGTNLPTRAGD